MRKSILLFLIIGCAAIAYAQQSRISFGLRANLGAHGIKPPLQWENRKESQSRVDIGIFRPKINFSSAILLRYVIYNGKKIKWNLTLEGGYDYSEMRKEWHFRSGYDQEFIEYTREVRIIHELKSHQFIVPLKVNVEFGKVVFSIGFIGNKVMSATVHRTHRDNLNLLPGLWIDEKVTWTANKKESAIIEFNTPFLTQNLGLEGSTGFAYYLSDQLLAGFDLSANLSSGVIRVFAGSLHPSDFHYASHKASVKLILLL